MGTLINLVLTLSFSLTLMAQSSQKDSDPNTLKNNGPAEALVAENCETGECYPHGSTCDRSKDQKQCDYKSLVAGILNGKKADLKKDEKRGNQ